jgi:hypothetical protein
MQDAGYYHQRAAEALREADLEKLPNARKKHLAAAEVWHSMAVRIDRVNEFAARKAAARVDSKAFGES